MSRILIAAASAALVAMAALAPLLVPQPASADTIYPWCLYDSRGGTNCGFVNERQCRASKTANADMCGLNGLYYRYPARQVDRPPYYGSKRYRYRG